MEPLPQHNLERLEYFLQGDKAALLFCLDLLYIAHAWDDLVDGDKPLTGEEINQTFIKCLASIPNNPFYQAFAPSLLPMMYNALTMYVESNWLRRGDRDQRVTAFSLENAVIEIIHFCILGKGIDWARQVAEEFWGLFGPTASELEECLGLPHLTLGESDEPST